MLIVTPPGHTLCLTKRMAKTRRKGTDEPPAEVPAAPQSAGDTTAAAAPDRERIEARAYELYLARGAGDGDAMEDWLAAERESTDRKKTRREE